MAPPGWERARGVTSTRPVRPDGPVLATLRIRARAWRESGLVRHSTGYLISCCEREWACRVLSNPHEGPGARRSALVAAGPAEVGERDRRSRTGRDPLPAGASQRERCAP